jgi:hypothetical protein
LSPRVGENLEGLYNRVVGEEDHALS